MLRNLILVWLGVLFTIILTSCGKNWGSAVPTQYSLDGVKRITQGTAGDEKSTWGQERYTVSTTSRLLLRFETLAKHVPDIDTSGGKKVTVLLSLKNASDLTSAIANLKLCPVTRAWMMLASWDLAHPFLGGEAWSSKGGDYETAGCVLPTQLASSTATLEYDMTQWYIDYPKGRGYNYGLLTVTTQIFEIEGDQSGSYSPRIAFEE